MESRLRRVVPAFLLVVLPMATLLSQGLGRPPAGVPPASASGLDLQAINRPPEACTDFYQFACGGWLSANPIPADCHR